MIRIALCVGLLLLSACQTSPRGTRGFYAPPPDRGQYIRPDYLSAVPTPGIPAADLCRSQLYQGLIGQPEGAIFIPGLPGAKRVLKPATTEDFDDGEDPFPLPPTYLEVRDYLPGQTLYAPSIRTPGSIVALGDLDMNRLTLELDEEGFVREVRCG
ncbi:MAG: hypothetical protein HKN36_14125 [Hellea sp.]|nr:hypothetical protein [Hellea sp.]